MDYIAILIVVLAGHLFSRMLVPTKAWTFPTSTMFPMLFYMEFMDPCHWAAQHSVPDDYSSQHTASED